MVYVVLLVPTIAVVRDALFLSFYRIVDRKHTHGHESGHIDQDNLEIMPVTNGYYILEKKSSTIKPI